MRLPGGLRSVRTLLHRERLEREVDEELQFALDELTARYVARGLAADAALAAARSELGHVDLIKADIRSMGLAHRIENLRHDVRHVVRGLVRAPVFSAAVVLIVAGGVGPATAIFSIVNTLLLEPLPYRSPHELVGVWQDLNGTEYTRAPLSGPELRDLQRRGREVADFAGIWASTVALADGPAPEQLRVGLVTPNFFDLLGVEPQLGRSFRSGDDAHQRPAIVLSWEVWQRRYGGDSALVGTRIPVNGRPTTVIGVMPPDFRLLLAPDAAIPDDQQAWLLLSPQALTGPRQQQFLRTVGRMRAGVELATAQREISAIGVELGREHREYRPHGLTFYAVALQSDSTREVKTALLGLLGAVFVLLVIGCVNVANLMVTRSLIKRHEIQVRVAVGASRGRLWRQALIEGLVLSVAGGVLGLLLAIALLHGLLAMRPDALARLDLTRLDVRVFAFASLVSIGCGILFSLAPIPQLLARHVRSPTAPADGDRQRGPVRSALVTVQIALCGLLVITSCLVARGFREVQRIDPGFADEGVLTFKLALPLSSAGRAGATGLFSRRVRERLARVRGVSAVGATSHLPYDTVPNWGTPFAVTRGEAGALTGIADARAISPGYFGTISATLVHGRNFNEDDVGRRPAVAIIDHQLAEQLWPGGTAVGQYMLTDPLTSGAAGVQVTIVGVVRHIRDRELTRDGLPQIYFPIAQAPRDPLAYVVKTTMPPKEVVQAIRGALLELDASMAVYEIRPLREYTRDARAVGAFTFALLAAFAVSALFLAAVGVYGVTAYRAASRRREFGVRIALGAGSLQIAALVLTDALRVVLLGSVAGAVGSFAAATAVRIGFLVIRPYDPAVYAVGMLFIVSIAAAASLVPAMRAASTNASDVLRAN